MLSSSSSSSTPILQFRTSFHDGFFLDKISARFLDIFQYKSKSMNLVQTQSAPSFGSERELNSRPHTATRLRLIQEWFGIRCALMNCSIWYPNCLQKIPVWRESDLLQWKQPSGTACKDQDQHQPWERKSRVRIHSWCYFLAKDRNNWEYSTC